MTSNTITCVNRHREAAQVGRPLSCRLYFRGIPPFRIPQEQPDSASERVVRR